ncbi:MAG: serine/threonine protein kinase [Chloroflexi bacterium]|nr:serine/threonine protein kinase [Chloroflexota bacterium]
MIPTQIGRYEIKEELGRGGMAMVYRASDPEFGREVAVKVLPPEMLHDPSFRARFKREAKIIASLEHPAIVPVYDFGEDNGQPYLVMRYMTGGSLAQRLQQGPMALPEVSRIVSALAAALDEAHNKGIIHRDLKPANILFDQHRLPYIADFGIAKMAEGTASFTGSAVVGTPAYMSPEQVRGGRDIDGRSDLYSFGLIVFEMLTAQQPFKADTPVAMAMKHIGEPPPRLRVVRPDLPPACQDVLDRLLAKDRAERPANAVEVAQDLEAIAGGRPLPPRLGGGATVVETAIDRTLAHMPAPVTRQAVPHPTPPPVIPPPVMREPARTPPPPVQYAAPVSASTVAPAQRRGLGIIGWIAIALGVLAISIVGGIFLTGGFAKLAALFSGAATSVPATPIVPVATDTPSPAATPDALATDQAAAALTGQAPATTEAATQELQLTATASATASASPTPRPAATATAVPPTTAPPTNTPASSGPLATRRVQFVSAQRVGDNNQALATLSLEFTGGAGPYTLSGDGIASPITKGVSGTFIDNGVTYNYIHFEVASSCGAQMPGTVNIRDSGGQSASQTYFVTVNCP